MKEDDSLGATGKRLKLKPPETATTVTPAKKAGKSLPSLPEKIKAAEGRLKREKKGGDKKRIERAQQALSRLQAQLTKEKEKENVNEGMPGEQGGLARQVAGLATRVVAIETKLGIKPADPADPGDGDEVTLEEDIANMLERY